MISITNYSLEGDNKIHFNFSDGTEKTIDFEPFIGEDKLSQPLSDPSYFQQVSLYENGRGIFWPNQFDFCPDFLRNHKADEYDNWSDYDDENELEESDYDNRVENEAEDETVYKIYNSTGYVTTVYTLKDAKDMVKLYGGGILDKNNKRIFPL